MTVCLLVDRLELHAGDGCGERAAVSLAPPHSTRVTLSIDAAGSLSATYQIIASLERLQHLHHVPKREDSIKRISLHP